MFVILAVIYIVFISLGLPDSIFGASWPVIHLELGAAESFASFYTIITGVSGAVSSFFSGPLIRKLGTGTVTFISILLTVVGMVGMSFAPSFVILMFCAVIMGLGAGAIDTGLNNFVSLHYKANHMSWLHAFWGVGVTVSPLIISAFLVDDAPGWRWGYRTIAGIQFVIALITAVSLKKWRSIDKPADNEENTKSKQKPSIIKEKGLILSIISMGCYTAMEFMIGTWGATYFVNTFSADASTAAKWVSFYFFGVMSGRIISGFVAEKAGDNNMIRFGIGFSLIGMILLLLPVSFAPYIGFLLIGLGFAPVFPSIVHAVPFRFGSKFSVDYTGYTMGGGYAIGYTLSLLFGFAAKLINFSSLPFVMLALAVLVIIFNEIVISRTRVNSENV